MFKLIALIITLHAYWLWPSAAMATGNPLLRGVNLAGAEFAPNRFPDGTTINYTFPTAAKLQYYSAAGFSTIRLPFTWEQLQPKQFGALNPVYLAQITHFLDEAALRNQRVVLDMHNFGRYNKNIVGTAAVPAKAFRNFWWRLAKVVKNHPALLAYGLMNEPHDMNGHWPLVAQAGVDGVRYIDSSHPIYVAGDGWSNAQHWAGHNPQPFVKDPKKLIVYEAHIFFDADYSGHYSGGLDSTVDLPLLVEQRLQPFISWLSTYRQRGIIGEWGVPDDPKWQPAMDKFMDMADRNCLGWFYWAGGTWKDSYPLSLEPINGVDRPKLQRLQARLQNPAPMDNAASLCKWRKTR